MKLSNLTYHPQKYLAFVLSDVTASALRHRFPPKFAKVFTHHVTLAFDSASFDAVTKLDLDNLEVFALAHVEGEVDGKGLECFMCSVNGYVNRLSLPGKYHVTHSLSPSLKPVHSNRVLDNPHAVVFDYFDQPLRLSGRVMELGK